MNILRNIYFRGFIYFIFLSILINPIYSFDYYEEGVKEYEKNNFNESIPLLYQASLNENTNPKVFMYLGLSYQYVGKNADAISTFIKGTASSRADKASLFFNAGNVYFSQESFVEAESMYTNSINSNTTYANAYLNRANSRVKLKKFEEALNDYTQYLYLDPASWQREAILQMSNLLKGEIENQKTEQIRAEAAKLAEEAEKKAQEERYQKLLDSINSSLQSVDGASVFSAGSENVLDYEEEGQLD